VGLSLSEGVTRITSSCTGSVDPTIRSTGDMFQRLVLATQEILFLSLSIVSPASTTL
jgi:hypothetical protein